MDEGVLAVQLLVASFSINDTHPAPQVSCERLTRLGCVALGHSDTKRDHNSMGLPRISLSRDAEGSRSFLDAPFCLSVDVERTMILKNGVICPTFRGVLVSHTDVYN